MCLATLGEGNDPLGQTRSLVWAIIKYIALPVKGFAIRPTVRYDSTFRSALQGAG